jgi:hypothetical protein
MPQIEGQCLNDASTNPSNPINNEMKDANGNPLNGHTVNEFKNQFNWGSHTGSSWNGIPVFSSGLNWSFTPGNPMFSPFSTQMPSEYSYLHQNGALPTNCDWHWEDGWELMWMNLGYYPNLENISIADSGRIISSATSLANPKTPYFFLYNRYTGKLRHFGNLYGDLSNSIGQQVITRLSHVKQSEFSPVSGVFRHLGSYDRALDLPTLHTYIVSNNPYPGNNNTWFSSDFQLGFDPCVCEQPTLWQLDYESVNTWNVNLQGRQVAQTLPINAFQSDFLTNNSIDGSNNKGGGSILFKNMEKMYDAYLQEHDAYKDKLATYNKLENQIFREIIVLAKTLTVNGITGAGLPSAAVKSYITNFMKPFDGNFDADNSAEMAKGIRKASDNIIGKSFDFLTKQFIPSSITTAPEKPSVMPTATFSELVINGTIGQTFKSSIANLYNPGSFKPAGGQIGAFNYPYWNKPVGLFALLKTPHVKFYHNELKGNIWGYFNNYERNWGNPLPPPFADRKFGEAFKICDFFYEQEINFRLGDRIWYKFNDNIDINKTTSNILVAISVILESDAGEELYFDDENYGKFQNVDISKTNLEVFRHLSKDNDKKEQLTLSSPWMKIEDAQEFNFGGTLRVNARFPVQQGTAQLFTTTGMIQHDYSTTHSNLINIVNGQIALKGDLVDQLKFKVKKIIVKVMPSMDFNSLSSAGTKINTTQEFSYLLYDKDANINLINTKGQWLNSTNKKQGAERYIPYKITLDNVTLTTNSPYVNSIVGNKIIVNANEIEILNGLSVQSGYIAELNAFKEINVISGDINSDISLNIKNDFYNSSKITEATQAEVNGFCKDLTKEYKADIDASSSLI